MRSRTRKLRVKQAQSTCSQTTADVTESEAPFMWIYLELCVMEKMVLLTVRWFDGTSTNMLARWCGTPRKCNVALGPYKQHKPLLCHTCRKACNAINTLCWNNTVLKYLFCSFCDECVADDSGGCGGSYVWQCQMLDLGPAVVHLWMCMVLQFNFNSDQVC